jgi:glycosyltransferase involved in cell wall biosynthesis
MKLCFLAGADSIHSVRWIKYFAEKGHEVHWISLTPSTQGTIKDVKLYLFKGLKGPLGRLSPLNMLSNAIRVKRLIREINPDILHAHYAGVNGVTGALSGFHPFLLTVWGSDVLISAKSKIKGPLIKYALNKTDLITCDANHMRDAMTKLGVDAGKINLIYFGVDTQKFHPGGRNEGAIKKLGIADSPAVISLRNLEPIYDVETLIKAIPQVLADVPQAKFVIAGKGSQEDELKRLAASLGVFESTRFIGWIPNDEIPQYLTSMDICVSTSLSDAGIAASTAEAMSCGLPVIITDSAENSEWVRNGESGFIIPVKDAATLAGRITALLKSRATRSRLGEKGRKVIEERNNYYVEMEKMEDIYQEQMQAQS